MQRAGRVRRVHGKRIRKHGAGDHVHAVAQPREAAAETVATWPDGIRNRTGENVNYAVKAMADPFERLDR